MSWNEIFTEKNYEDYFRSRGEVCLYKSMYVCVLLGLTCYFQVNRVFVKFYNQ